MTDFISCCFGLGPSFCWGGRGRGEFQSPEKRTRFLFKQKDSYKIPTKKIEISAEGVQDSKN